MQFQYQNTNLLSTNTIFQTAQSLTSYIIHLNDVIARSGYTDPECSINLPTDMDLLDNVNDAVQTYSGQQPTANSHKPRFIIDIGIGGSNLGTKAVYDALYGHFDAIEPTRSPKMIFLDTNDETYIAKLVSFLNTITDPNDIVINAISKSGGTTETIANLEIVYQTLMAKFPTIKERVVITTDEGSKLEARAQELEIKTLSLPKLVGGRYSVLSAVGLFPLALCGLDINALRTGAEEMRRLCVSSNTANNPALLSAAILYLHSQAGKTIHDTFTFLPQLESLGKWYRQLMGESIGKEHDTTRAVVNAGMTPTVSVGSTDLHSVGQLYLGGPKDKITTFIQSGIQKLEARVPAQMQFPLVSSIAGKRASELMNAIREGVQIAYTKQQLPYMSLVFDGVDEKEIGAFFQFKMIEMMYLGKLFNVNTFDQPHVELYKTETKRILQNV